MARVFITGSSDGLGLMAARLLLEQGHLVVAHARSERRAEETSAALPDAEQVVIGDLSSIAQTRDVADRVNALGGANAVIYDAGVGPYEKRRIETADGLAHVFEINVLAPYILTSLIARPQRVVYLTSGLHRGGDPALDDPQWQRRRWRGSQAYSDSKLYDLTQAWLAVSDEPAALVSGDYSFHKKPQHFHPAARAAEFQGALTDYCAQLSGLRLPD